jgi:hypothetical protein
VLQLGRERRLDPHPDSRAGALDSRDAPEIRD